MRQFLSAALLILIWCKCINNTKQLNLPIKLDDNTHFYRSFIKQLAAESFNRVELKNALTKAENDTCTQSFSALLSTEMDINTLKFLDSWGKLPSGILRGHFFDLGNFDECLSARKTITVNGVRQDIEGKYFLLGAAFVTNVTTKMQIFDLATGQISYVFGTCFPQSCTGDEVRNLFQTQINTIPKLLTLLGKDVDSNSSAISNVPVRITLHSSSKNPNQSFDTLAIIAISVFAFIGGLIVLSSCYEYYAANRNVPPNLLLIAFSLFANGRKLFHINTSHTSAHNIECLNGIRVFSMIWVLYGHTYSWASGFPYANFLAVTDWMKAPYSMLIQNATVSVDSFLLMSGILTAWVTLNKMDKEKGRINIPLMYLHRFIRLTPVLAATVLFVVGIVPYIGDGPLWQNFTNEITKNCQTNWWITLLYSNNYVKPGEMCLGHSWYLSVDNQLFLISPFILMGLWRWRTKCIWALVVLACLSYGCTISTMVIREFHDLLMGGLRSTEQAIHIYYPTHLRMAPWLIGVIFGYFLYHHRHKQIRIPTLVLVLGWLIAISSMLAVIFGPYHLAKNRVQPSIIEAALYAAFGRTAWVLGLSWIILTCQLGHSRTLNSILSFAGWQPIVRLTYAMYVVTIIVQGLNGAIIQTDKHFSTYELIQTFWAELGISLCVSIVVVLALESPIIAIEKYFYSLKKSNTLESSVQGVNTSTDNN